MDIEIYNQKTLEMLIFLARSNFCKADLKLNQLSQKLSQLVKIKILKREKFYFIQIFCFITKKDRFLQKDFARELLLDQKNIP